MIRTPPMTPCLGSGMISRHSSQRAGSAVLIVHLRPGRLGGVTAGRTGAGISAPGMSMSPEPPTSPNGSSGGAPSGPPPPLGNASPGPDDAGGRGHWAGAEPPGDAP